MNTLAERNYPRVPAKPIRDRLLASIKLSDEGCWLWRKSVKANGYAQIRIPGTGAVYVHCAAYEEFRGPIPNGMQSITGATTRTYATSATPARTAGASTRTT